MRPSRLTIVLASLVLLAPLAAHAGDLQLRIENGRVFLIAHEVPARQILAEWSRVGQTKVVNGDKVFGPPLTLEFNGITERQALETILRSATGYMAASRPAGSTGASMYDRILIMASGGGAAPPPAAMPRSPQPFIPPQAAPPSMQPQQGMDENEDQGNDPANFVNPNAPETFPQAQPFNPRANPGGPFAPTPFPGPGGANGQPNNVNIPALTPVPNTTPDEEEDVSPNPWGVQGGSTTPGVINPPPQGDPNQRPPN